MNELMQEGAAPAALGNKDLLNDEQRRLVEEHGAEMKFLEELRASGAANMFGAGRYLEEAFPLGTNMARKVLSAWMMNYTELARFYGWRA